MAGADYSLTAFGLLSFAAAAQFGPALVGGILWRRGNYTGAVWGLGLGFLIWCYTLLLPALAATGDRKSTRLNSSHVRISYAVFCLKKKKKKSTAVCSCV